MAPDQQTDVGDRTESPRHCATLATPGSRRYNTCAVIGRRRCSGGRYRLASLASYGLSNADRTLAAPKGRVPMSFFTAVEASRMTMHRWHRRRCTLGTPRTAGGWSTSPAGRCRCSTRRSSPSTGHPHRGRPVRHLAHGPAAFRRAGLRPVSRSPRHAPRDRHASRARSAIAGDQRRRRHPRRRAGLSSGRRRRRLVSPAGRQRQQPREDRRLDRAAPSRPSRRRTCTDVTLDGR